jgi:mitochondrial fission protein ELM1
MLSAKRVRKGKIVVIMKPSLPLNFFDICVIPKHDAPPKKKNVIETNGALNTLEFNNNKSKNLGLILIGGPSKHYEWNSKLIISQIDAVVSRCKEINWTISDSPRTPKNMMSKILASNYKNVDILDFNNSPNKNIRKLIFMAKDIWVSPDSVSMIYESLTSGASVGLFEMLKKRKNRIYTSVDNLITENHVTTFSAWGKTNALQTNNLNLSESKRCASIILERLL